MYMHGKLMARGDVNSRKIQSQVPVEWLMVAMWQQLSRVYAQCIAGFALALGLGFLSPVGQQGASMEELEHACLDREGLRGGKYTKWAAELSAEQFYGLLWMVGEFGIRASAHDPQSDARYLTQRRDAGRQAVIDCVRGHARTMAEAQQMIVTGTNRPAIRGSG